jgi:hypothetical protein
VVYDQKAFGGIDLAELMSMPPIVVPASELLSFGKAWHANKGSLSRTPPSSSMELGALLDHLVGKALATMLGGIPIVKPSPTELIPQQPDCVEVGTCRVIGGVRPQNFDVVYCPDGVRFAFDSKTLNDCKSVQKNYQNMINDLGTEATTVHTRFPYALVAFLVAVPHPCLSSPQKEALTGTLERLSSRASPLNSNHKAEAISLVVWDPESGEVDRDWPENTSCLRIERFSQQIQTAYLARYKGLPPHA